jgi:hypothetical protein
MLVIRHARSASPEATMKWSPAWSLLDPESAFDGSAPVDELL